MRLLLNAATPQILLSIGLGAVALVLVRVLLVDRRRWGAGLLRGLRRLEIGLLAGLLGLMILLSALQIVLRNLLDAGLLWVDPLLRYATLWIGLLGAAYATAGGRHIQIDALARLSPPAVRALAGRVVAAVAAAVCLVLAETTLRYVIEEHRAGYRLEELGAPTWVLVAVLPAAFALMCYRFLYRVVVPLEPALPPMMAAGGDGAPPPPPTAGGAVPPPAPEPGR